MIYWWQRILAVLAAIVADLMAIYFLAPQLFIGRSGVWYTWILEIAILIGVYIIVTKAFERVNDKINAREWAKRNKEIKVNAEGEITKLAEKDLVFNTVSELVNKESIDDLHYTTLIVYGHLITEGSKHYITEKGNSGEIARLETLFDGDIPDIADEEKHCYKGTLMVENGRILLQWTKFCQ